MAARTLYQLLREAAHTYGDAPALRQPNGAGRLTYSWNQYLRAAEEIGAGLRSLGIAPGEIVALDSETRLEFYLADLGIFANGSIAAALYPSYPPRDLVKSLAAVQARAVFVEDAKTLAAVRRGAGGALDSADRRSRGRHHPGRFTPSRPRSAGARTPG